MTRGRGLKIKDEVSPTMLIGRKKPGVEKRDPLFWEKKELPADLPPLGDLFPVKPKTLEVEIGCGKGKFLVGRATAEPGVHFIGVDTAGKWMKIGARRGEKRFLDNLRFVRVDARIFVEKYLPSCSISVFHIYFPDPWPKKRHHKRRIAKGDFLLLLKEKLAAGGRIEIATDNHPYYLDIQNEVDSLGPVWASRSETVNKRLYCEAFKTSYELKYEAEGRPLYYMELVK